MRVAASLRVPRVGPAADRRAAAAAAVAVLEARTELAGGDLRLLYLGWLLKVQLSGLGDEDADFEDDGEGLADESSRRSRRAYGSRATRWPRSRTSWGSMTI
jgi:hypothetical protein